MLAYKILDIEVCDDDQKIREAYLKKIQTYPPEKEPERYQTIYKAYEKIQTHQKRLEYFLFENDADISFDEYERIIFKVDKTIIGEKWNQICQLFQNRK